MRGWILLISLVAFCFGPFGCESDDTNNTGQDNSGSNNNNSDIQTGNWACEHADETKPQFRMTALTIEAPVQLVQLGLVQGLLDDAVNNLEFIWAIEFDLENDTITTGSATSANVPPETEEDLCEISWVEESPPIKDIAITENDDGTISTTNPMAEVKIPMTKDGAHLLDLIVSELQIINMELSDDLTTIGRQPSTIEEDFAYSQGWETGGTVSGYISLSSAREIEISLMMNQSLCEVLCPGSCAEEKDLPDEEAIEKQREALAKCGVVPIPNTSESGWELRGSFGAAAVTIQ